MQTLTVDIKEKPYPIYIGCNLLAESALLARHLSGRQVMLVSNETVAPLYLQRVLDHLTEYQVSQVVLPDGEAYKTLASIEKIFDELLTHHFSRQATLIALGGGVIGDMTGFAAACYQRGIQFIQIPTSLLAQVDASVGGKTGVNHRLGKNMMGAFHQPQCVIIDTATLATLPEREFKAGLAEVIKHGLIRDAAFFAWLEQHMDDLLAKQPAALTHAIATCCQIKAAVVAADEREQSIRAILNFGHTVGHAIEAGLGYGHWLHGEAVAVGMVIAAELSCRLELLSPAEVARIKRCIEAAGLPTEAPAAMRISDCQRFMAHDKKALESGLRFVLLKGIGDAILQSGVTESCIKDVLQHSGFTE